MGEQGAVRTRLAADRVILAFDVETDGLINQNQPPEHSSQPNLVQVAGLLMDIQGHERACVSLIIRPDGWQIPSVVSKVHGITDDIAMNYGVPLIVAMGMISNLIKVATVHVAHNAEFDIKVLLAAFHRIQRPSPPFNIRCTKVLATPLMRLPPTERMLAAGFDKPKPPTLAECVKYFLDEDVINAHDALADARACGRVYLEMLRRGCGQ